MKRTVALSFLLALAACEDTGKVMQSWVGESDMALMAKWGAPDLQAKGADGGSVLTYNGRNGYGQIICRQNFQVNAQHKIVQVSHNC